MWRHRVLIIKLLVAAALLHIVVNVAIPTAGTALYRQLSRSNPVGQSIADVLPDEFAQRAASEDATPTPTATSHGRPTSTPTPSRSHRR